MGDVFNGYFSSVFFMEQDMDAGQLEIVISDVLKRVRIEKRRR